MSLGLLAAMAFVGPRPVAGGDAGAPSQWGAESAQVAENLPVGAAAFRPRAASIAFARDSEGYLWATTSADAVPFWAPVHLPSGALVDKLHLIHRTIQGSQLAASLVRRSGTTVPVTTVVATVAAPAGTGVATVDLTALSVESRTVDNLGAQYLIEVGITNPTAANALRGVVIEWRRQVHPAPTFARFSDVPPGDWQFKYVEALQAAGLTQGCTPPTLYCPNQDITRAQMAVYLSTALGLFWKP